MNEVQKRLNDFISYLGMSVSQFEQSIGVGNAFVKNTNERMRNSSKNLIATRYPELNMDWLMKGRGEMLKPISNTINSYGNNSANAINGNATIISTSQKRYKEQISKENDGIVSETNETLNNIHIGDLFKEATSAIINNDDSMREYPLGAIIILKRLTDDNNILWGNNYYIETCDYKIIRRVQKNNDKQITAYSSNEKTNQDGTLIHSPIIIPKKSIISISSVLGYIKKEENNNIVL
jgi:hypothetical protein